MKANATLALTLAVPIIGPFAILAIFSVLVGPAVFIPVMLVLAGLFCSLGDG